MDDAPNRTGRRDTPALVARALDNPLTLLFARVCLTLPFLATGVAKLLAWNAGVAGMADHGLEPAWAFNLATIVTDLGGAALVILDRRTWLGAGARDLHGRRDLDRASLLGAHRPGARHGIQRLPRARRDQRRIHFRRGGRTPHARSTGMTKRAHCIWPITGAAIAALLGILREIVDRMRGSIPMSYQLIKRSALVLLGLVLIGSAQAQTRDVRPLGIGLEDIDYPYPVRFFDVTVENQPLRMAYMDVAPTATANGLIVVLLHGKSFSGDYWGRTIAMLAGNGYRVVVPDQLGFGKSAKPDIRYSFDLLARNTKALLDSLGIARAAIVGHSFGGMLAVFFARDYPETTAVLVLENPIGLEDYRSAIPPQPIEKLVETEMAQTPVTYRSFMAAFFVGWPPQAQHYVDIFTRVLLSSEYPRWARASALTYQMIFDEPIRHEYPLLKMPVLLIIGQSDRSVFFRRYASADAVKPLGNWPALGRQAVKDLSDGKLVEITGAGHVSHVEQPDKFEAALAEFLTTRFR
jgi:pimeloyl-ACP methyl ester carboxylesterase